MYFDSLMLRRIQAELQELAGTRVQRVFPTGRLEFVLELRTRAPLDQIVINVTPELGRLHRDEGREPALGLSSPLADVLRRHLRGATLVEARQYRFDRVLQLEFANAEGMGPQARRTLVAELTGRHANLLLLDEENIILECARHVPSSVNRVRQLLPGERYVPPPDFGKLDPSQLQEEQLAERWPKEAPPLGDWLRAALQGMSDLLIAILCERLGWAPDTAISAWMDWGPALLQTLREILELSERPGEAYIGVREGRRVAYPLPFPCGWQQETKCPSLSTALCQLAAVETETRELTELRARLQSALQAAWEKARRREAERGAALAEAEQADAWRRQGALLLAHLGRWQPGQREVVATDWETGETITIVLDPPYSPVEQAQHCFARYKKLQRVREYVPALLAEARREREQLEDLLRRVAAGGIEDLRALEAELVSRGLLKTSKQRRPLKTESSYRRTETTDGYIIIYGRNALENAAVLKAAQPNDLWFHVQNSPGGHIIVRTNNHPEDVPETTIVEAARLAARQSRKRHDTTVPVDYTLVKHLRPLRGAGPGQVTYREFKTIIVRP